MMSKSTETSGEVHAVTGAYGYSGKYIAARLLDMGKRVVTLTNSPDRPHPFGDAVPARPLTFQKPDALIEALRGVEVLYNTYWVRFNHRSFTYRDAVRNTRVLFRAAKEAGVARIVHVSITNPALDSPLEYFSGKAVLEAALVTTGVSHAILRPTVLFGKEDILINNIAWMLRRLPIFGVFGDGQYALQPIHVDDLAALAVAQGMLRENTVVNAIGPETFTYRELVKTIADAIGRRRPIVSVPPHMVYAVARAVGVLVQDTIVTHEEIAGLMAGLLRVHTPPTGTTRLTEWARANANQLGRRYASELGRRNRRDQAYFVEAQES
jgi:NADH dehydrogenase